MDALCDYTAHKFGSSKGQISGRPHTQSMEKSPSNRHSHKIFEVLRRLKKNRQREYRSSNEENESDISRRRKPISVTATGDSCQRLVLRRTRTMAGRIREIHMPQQTPLSVIGGTTRTAYYNIHQSKRHANPRFNLPCTEHQQALSLSPQPAFAHCHKNLGASERLLQ